jgi:hypothetical protein
MSMGAQLTRPKRRHPERSEESLFALFEKKEGFLAPLGMTTGWQAWRKLTGHDAD